MPNALLYSPQYRRPEDVPNQLAAGNYQGELRATTPSFRDHVVEYLTRIMGDNRNAYQLADKITSGLELTTPLGIGTGAYDVGRRAAEAGIAPSPQTVAAAGLTAATMLPFGGRIARLAESAAREAPSVAAMGIKAYHGSPHSFERFSTEKIGTGEGAQAYGHGLYFAENEGVARGYRNTLAKGFEYQGAPVHPNSALGSALDFLKSGLKSDEPLDTAISQRVKELREHADFMRESDPYMGPGENMYDRAADRLAEIDPTQLKRGGRMYEVDINAEPEQFLDYDARLSEQSPEVQNILREKLGFNQSHFLGDTRGANVYESSRVVPGDYRDPSAASQRLREAGIPGIKYADAGSRVSPSELERARERVKSTTADEKTLEIYRKHLADLERRSREATSNYVVFDDKMISILKKYGLAGLGLGVGSNMLAGSMPQQQQQQ